MWCYSNQINNIDVVVEYLILLSEIFLSENNSPFFPQGNGYSPAPLDLSNVVLSREIQVCICVLHVSC